MSNYKDFAVSQLEFKEGRYLAFVLDQNSRKKLIETIGAHFPIRVCHHITITYSGPQTFVEAERIADWVYSTKGTFTAIGYRITDEAIVIDVIDKYGCRERPNGEMGILHITYERSRALQDSDSISIMEGKHPYTFTPCCIELEGNFQFLEKGGHTPIEVADDTVLGIDGQQYPQDSFQDVIFSSDKAKANNGVYILAWDQHGYPKIFLHQDFLKAETITYVHKHFERIMTAWCKLAFKPLPKESKIGMFSSGPSGNGWIPAGKDPEGRPTAFVLRNKNGLSLEVGEEDESFERLIEAWSALNEVNGK